MNETDMFVSIYHQRRGEYFRLYTHEPEKVYELLNQLIYPNDEK